MTMQKVHLDISSDIFDKVMFILENLPPNKVKYTIEKQPQNIEEVSDEEQKEYEELFSNMTPEDREVSHSKSITIEI
jgi:hypothetical protein